MIKNYFKVAIRNLIKRRSFTLLNVFGLAVGMAACMLLFLVVRYELSYNKSLPEHESVYHVVTQSVRADGVDYTPGIPYPALDAIRLEMPQVLTGAIQATNSSQVTVLGKDPNVASTKRYIEGNNVYFADPEFFKIFQYKWLSGDPSILAQPDVTVLTRKMAEKYFGSWQSALGQYIKMDNVLTVKVAGILDEPALNTDYPIAVITSLITSKNNPDLYNYSKEWGSTSSNFQIFMKMPANMRSSQIDEQFKAFGTKYYEANPNSKRSNFLQPLAEVHFDRRFANFGDHTISKSTLWTLSLIGAFIIIMACINFINLSTAQAINRSKEIGIRKVLGSKRSNLFWQMMGETAIVVFIAWLLAFGIAKLSLPYINNVTSIVEPLSLFNGTTIGFSLLVALIVTLFSGSYPALILSGFRPMLALKNKITSASIGGISLRRGLVVTQFAISQVLIIGTIIAIAQMNHVKKADLGFNKDAVLVLNSNSDSTVQSRQEAFKRDLLGQNGIQAVSFGSDVPSSENNWATNFAFDHKEDQNFSLFMKFGDVDFFKTYGIEFLAGKGFEASDTITSLVINETLARRLGLKDPEQAIGKEIRMGSNRWRSIIGVVKDFQTNTLRDEIKPLAIMTQKSFYGGTAIKMRSTNLAATSAAIQTTWDKYFPEYANSSFFLDESIENFYRQENQLALLYKIFAGIAILISCLGLYGLVSFMAVQRTKEVGIRKVLGASVSNIVFLFSKEFTILILIAFVVAGPVAWFLMNNWLDNFAYRVHPGVMVFVIAMLVSIVIAWITVGYKSIKAALSNPVKSLRTE